MQRSRLARGAANWRVASTGARGAAPAGQARSLPPMSRFYTTKGTADGSAVPPRGEGRSYAWSVVGTVVGAGALGALWKLRTDKEVLAAEEQQPSNEGIAPPRNKQLEDKPLPSGNVWVWGAIDGVVPSSSGSPSGDSLMPRLAKQLSGKGVRSLAFGDKTAAAVTDKGELLLWRVGAEEPTTVHKGGIEQVSCGRNGLIAALTKDGDVLLWDARTHAEGGLHPVGADDDWKNAKHVDVASLRLPETAKAATATSSPRWWPFGGGTTATAEKIVQVECGGGHVAMLTSQGRVLLMGDNNYGQTGTQDPSNETRGPGMVRPAPFLLDLGVAAGGSKAVSVSCGDTHTAVLLEDGAVFMLGTIHFSGLKGNTLYSDQPVLVPLTRNAKSVEKIGRVVQITCGGEHTLALTDYGVLLAWGNGIYGQVPDGQGRHINTPHTVLKPPFFNPEGKEFVNNGIQQFQCGNDHCLALTKSGDVWSFGRNDRGQCGLGNRAHQKTPHKVAQLSTRKGKIRAVACGQHTSAALEE